MIECGGDVECQTALLNHLAMNEGEGDRFVGVTQSHIKMKASGCVHSLSLVGGHSMNANSEPTEAFHCTAEKIHLLGPDPNMELIA
jgi:hypothetical protein